MGKAITKDSVFDSMRRVEAALKLRYMGIGFVWAWLYCTYATSAVFPYRSGQSINSDESWLLSAVAVVLGFLVGGLLLSRRPLGGHCLRRFSIAAARFWRREPLFRLWAHLHWGLRGWEGP